MMENVQNIGHRSTLNEIFKSESGSLVSKKLDKENKRMGNLGTKTWQVRKYGNPVFCYKGWSD
jgi:hypothetical protein